MLARLFDHQLPRRILRLLQQSPIEERHHRRAQHRLAAPRQAGRPHASNSRRDRQGSGSRFLKVARRQVRECRLDSRAGSRQPSHRVARHQHKRVLRVEREFRVDADLARIPRGHGKPVTLAETPVSRQGSHFCRDHHAPERRDEVDGVERGLGDFEPVRPVESQPVGIERRLPEGDGFLDGSRIYIELGGAKANGCKEHGRDGSTHSAMLRPFRALGSRSLLKNA